MATESSALPDTGANADVSKFSLPWFAVGLALVLSLAWTTRFLEKNLPTWFDWVWLKSVEYPVYAIALGLVGSGIIGLLGIREKVASAFRTEFFIKTGLVLLGASIHLHMIAKAGSRGVLQALILVCAVFFFTWWLAGKLKIGATLRALLASSVAICGVSAAIAAAGAVRASREQIAYTATLVILFALPSIFILPWIAKTLALTQAVAGAWIGGNIDTTAAVAAAGAIVGEEALQIAAIPGWRGGRPASHGGPDVGPDSCAATVCGDVEDGHLTAFRSDVFAHAFEYSRSHVRLIARVIELLPNDRTGHRQSPGQHRDPAQDGSNTRDTRRTHV